MIEYWHWNTLPFGTETYWGGILPHAGQPGRVYRELAALGTEFSHAGELVAGLVPDADVALVYSLPSQWIMQKYPPLAETGGSPDSRAYQGLFEPFYRGAFDVGLQVRILHPPQLGALAVDAFPVLIASGLYITDDETLGWLRSYALAGGHLILGPRTGYADHEGRARRERMPARLADIAGAWYDEFSNLRAPVRVVSAAEFPVPEDAVATRRVDGLRPDGATVLARYDHPHFGRWPTITTHAVGDGRVTCIGTVPGQSLAEALLRWPCTGRSVARRQVPATVTSTGATSADGRRLRFMHNWSWQSAAVTVPVACQDVLGGQRIAGEEIGLAGWDVRVLTEQ